MDLLPPGPGSYVLRLSLPRENLIQVGRLGVFRFIPGNYLYLGSAHGPGGLRARVTHHRRMTDSPHWHVDWLRQRAVLVGGWFSQLPLPMECLWSQALLALPGVKLLVPGFGSSDCPSGCPAHLVYLSQPDPIELVEETLRSIANDLQPFE